MKLFLNLACMVLVSTRFSAVKADKASTLVCNITPAPTIGTGACTEPDSCFCSLASIGANACIGVNACDFSVGTYGADSCLGDNACQYTIVPANTGVDSCVGENACQQAGGLIGARSCVGENACIGPVATIGADSCLGSLPGDSPCGDSAGGIGAGSCIGADPCRSTGTTVSIGAGSCIGSGTNCHCMSILMGAGSCMGEDACVGLTTGSVGIGSCTAKGSCYRSSGVIADGSCTGEDSCYKAAGSIADGSCTGEGSCWGTKATFSSAAGSCLGKNSCKCADAVYGAGACLTEDSCPGVCDIQEDTLKEAALFCPSRFNTPPPCPADVVIFATDGITTVDPGKAIWILNQDTQSVTVRLYNGWTSPHGDIDRIHYTYKDSAFSETCQTATDTLGWDHYDDITIHCNTVPFALLDICVVDSALDPLDTADIAPCCNPVLPQVTPAVCYKFVIHCESQCSR